ncbi:AMBRA1 [Branchiostoma lanceolatum]|uniref:AMBRA1 protein n=1 Tax=Branchiostoma lanceolatum TaxID=7740 RepID=A0A8J9ZMT7_BRALA|nr:AMBRA1 [Branchiostoma lanceolatum]
MSKRSRNAIPALQGREVGAPGLWTPAALRFLAEDKAALFSQDNQTVKLPGDARTTFLMAFSHDGTLMASSHGDHNIHVTDLRTGKCIRTLVGHSRTPWCVTFHPSSNEILASGCLDGEVRVWDLHGGSERWTSESNTVIASLTFHPLDQVLVIATGNALHFWDWSQDKPFAYVKTARETEKIRLVKFDPLGHHLLTGIANVPNVRPFDAGVVQVDSSDSETDMLPEPDDSELPPRMSVWDRRSRVLHRLHSMEQDLRRRLELLSSAAARLDQMENEMRNMMGSFQGHDQAMLPRGRVSARTLADPTSNRADSTAIRARRGGSGNMPPSLQGTAGRASSSSLHDLDARLSINHQRIRRTQEFIDRLRARLGLQPSSTLSRYEIPPSDELPGLGSRRGSEGSPGNRLRLTASSSMQSTTSNTSDTGSSSRRSLQYRSSIRRNIASQSSAPGIELTTPVSVHNAGMSNMNRPGVSYVSRGCGSRNSFGNVNAQDTSASGGVNTPSNGGVTTQGTSVNTAGVNVNLPETGTNTSSTVANVPDTSVTTSGTSGSNTQVSSSRDKPGNVAKTSEVNTIKNSIGSNARQPCNTTSCNVKNEAASITATSTGNVTRSRQTDSNTRGGTFPPGENNSRRQAAEGLLDLGNPSPGRPQSRLNTSQTNVTHKGKDSKLPSSRNTGTTPRSISSTPDAGGMPHHWWTLSFSNSQHHCQDRSFPVPHSRNTSTTSTSTAATSTTESSRPTMMSTSTSMVSSLLRGNQRNKSTSSAESVCSASASVSRNNRDASGDTHVDGTESDEDLEPPAKRARSSLPSHKASTSSTNPPNVDRASTSTREGGNQSVQETACPLLPPRGDLRSSPASLALSRTSSESSAGEGMPALSEHFTLPSFHEAVTHTGGVETNREAGTTRVTAAQSSATTAQTTTASRTEYGGYARIGYFSARPVRRGAVRRTWTESQQSGDDVESASGIESQLRYQAHQVNTARRRLDSLRLRSLRALRSRAQRAMSGESPYESQSTVTRPVVWQTFSHPTEPQPPVTPTRAGSLEPTSAGDGTVQESAFSTNVPSRFYGQHTRSESHRSPLGYIMRRHALNEGDREGSDRGGERVRRRLHGRFRHHTAGSSRAQPRVEYVHPHYRSVFHGSHRPSNAVHSAINRAIAGAFIGTGESAVASNIVNTTHRLQWWDFTKYQLPEISDASANVIVPHCKIHNDASIDISKDGCYLATFIPSHRGFPDDAVLSIISLQKDSLGDILYAKSFAASSGPNAISVSISPLGNYVLVGLASRMLHWQLVDKQMVAQVFQLRPAAEKALEGTLVHVQNVMHHCDPERRSHVSVNSACWLPGTGRGLVYGTNRGHLQICRLGYEPGSQQEQPEEPRLGPALNPFPPGSGGSGGNARITTRRFSGSVAQRVVRERGVQHPMTNTTATQTPPGMTSAGTQTDQDISSI